MNRAKEYKTSFQALRNEGFFHIFGSSTINKIIGFASTWAIVRIVSKPEYGVYSYAYNLYSFFLILSGLGIVSAFLQLSSETADNEKKERLYRYCMRFGLLVDVALAGLILIIGLFVPLPYDGSGFLLALMSMLPAATIVTELQLTYLRIDTRNVEYSRVNTLNSICVFVLSCVLAYLLKSPGLVLASYLAHLITAAILWKKHGVGISLRENSLTPKDKKGLFSISSISMVNNGLSQLMYLLDIFVLGLVITDSSVIASYKVATNIPTALQFIPQAIMVFAYPYFARNKDNPKWLKRNYFRLIVAFGVFNLFVSAAMFLLAEPIITVFFGRQYIDAVLPSRILSVSYFFSATFRAIAGNLLITQRKLKFNLFVSVFASALNTVLNVFLILKWQSMGAALATLITVAVSGMISTVYLLGVFRKKERQLVEGEN